MAGIAEVYRDHGLSGVALLGTARVLREAGNWLTGAAAGLTRRVIPSPATAPEAAARVDRNAEFKDRYAGRRCFVIGNGPSLATQDLAPLGDELTFVMNAFWKHRVLDRWQPSFYLFADPGFFDGSESMVRFFEDMRRRVVATTFFVPLAALPTVERLSLLPPERTYYVPVHGSLKDGLGGRPDLVRPVPGVINVVQLAVMVAMYMGCSPIYLLGLDHDWLAHRGADRHFYATKTVENHAEAHGELSRYSYKFLMECQLELWSGYEALAKAAATSGTRIVNATNGGFLDVFERGRYEDVVANAPR